MQLVSQIIFYYNVCFHHEFAGGVLYNHEATFGNKDLKIHGIYNCYLLSGHPENLMVHNTIFIFSYGLMLTDFLDKALPQDTGNSKDRGAFLRLFLLFCLYLINPLYIIQ